MRAGRHRRRGVECVPMRRPSRRFLGGEIGFLDIPRALPRGASTTTTMTPGPRSTTLWRVDAGARQEVRRWKA